jgi:hypothetical protein
MIKQRRRLRFQGFQYLCYRFLMWQGAGRHTSASLPYF